MANDNTGLLVLLGIAGYILLTRQSTAGTLPYTYPATSPSTSKGGGGASGSIGLGPGSTTSPQGTPGTSSNPASGSNPQTAQQGSGQPFGPPNPSTDPCNQASPDYDAILCTNDGGTEYWESGGIYQPISIPSPVINPSVPACEDDGDVCNPNGCSYDPGTCMDLSGQSIGVDTGDDTGGF